MTTNRARTRSVVVSLVLLCGGCSNSVKTTSLPKGHLGTDAAGNLTTVTFTAAELAIVKAGQDSRPKLQKAGQSKFVDQVGRTLFANDYARICATMSGLKDQADASTVLEVITPGGLVDAISFILGEIVRFGVFDDVNAECPNGARGLNDAFAAALKRTKAP